MWGRWYRVSGERRRVGSEFFFVFIVSPRPRSECRKTNNGIIGLAECDSRYIFYFPIAARSFRGWCFGF